MAKFRFVDLEKEYPPIISRAEISKYFSFLNPKTMANLAAAGLGPVDVIRCGKAILYPTGSLLRWLDDRVGKAPAARTNETKNSTQKQTRRGRKTKVQQIAERRA